jgi:hypothetical protein
LRVTRILEAAAKSLSQRGQPIELPAETGSAREVTVDLSLMQRSA